MAANDLLGKRQGAFGIAFEDVPGTAEALRVYSIPADSANIESVPTIYERVNNIDENPIGIEQSGYEFTWSFSGAELSAEVVGYLLWLWCGDGTPDVATANHPLLPTYTSHHFTMFKDHGAHIQGTDEQTEVLAGCRIGTLSIDQQHKSYAKISATGMGRSRTMIATPQPGNIDYTANKAALGWAGMLNANGGYFKLGWLEGSPGNIPGMTSFKLDLGREQARSGANIGTDDARYITEGGRTLTWEATLDLRENNTDLKTILANIAAGLRVRCQVDWETGADSLFLNIQTARITNNVKGELGTDAAPQIVTLQASGFVFDAAEGLIDGIAYDNVLSKYADRVGL